MYQFYVLAKVTVLEQRVVEKRQFTMADLLPTEVLSQLGVEPAGRNRLFLNCTVASRAGVEGLTKLFVIPIECGSAHFGIVRRK